MSISNQDILNAAFLSDAAYSQGIKSLDDYLAGSWWARVAYREFTVVSPLLLHFSSGGGFAAVSSDGTTLAIAFRGSDAPFIDDYIDTLNYQKWHYSLFAQLISDVRTYLANHSNITKVLVTGHSLGGAMAEIYISKDSFATDNTTLITFGSPGVNANARGPSDVAAIASDVLHFQHTGDQVPGVGGPVQGQIVKIELTDVPDGSFDIFHPEQIFQISEHKLGTYNASMTQIGGSELASQFLANPSAYRVVLDGSNQDGLGLFGTNGQDFIIGYQTDDIWGYGGDDLVDAGDGNDTIHGGGGNDIIDGGGGNDTLDGGADTDTVNFANAIGTYGFQLNGSDILVTGASEGTDTVLDTVELFQFGGQIFTRAGLMPIINKPPVAETDDFSTDENSAVSGSVLANDRDPEGHTLVVFAVDGASSNVGKQIALASGALLTVSADGSMTYNPNGAFESLYIGQTATDGFSYTVSDDVQSATATVTVTVNGINDAPVAQNGMVSGDEDTTISGQLTATDIDGNPLTYSIASQPQHGTIVVNPDWTFNYTPVGNFYGPDSFTYKANDGLADSNTATVVLTVNPVNHAPVAFSGEMTDNEDAVFQVPLGAFDVEGDSLTYTVVTQPTHGFVTIDGATATYVPTQPNFNGVERFAFKVNDGVADSNIATMTMNIAPANDLPLPVPVKLTTDEDVAVSGQFSATDVDGDNLTYTIAHQPLHGVVTHDGASANFSYTPNPDFNGSDVFSYFVSDGTASMLQTVTIDVNPVNDPAVISGPSGSVTEDGRLTATGQLTVTDPDTGEASFRTDPVAGLYGNLAITDAGAWTYTLNNGLPAVQALNTGQSLIDQLTVRSFDGSFASLQITINGVNDAITGTGNGGIVNGTSGNDIIIPLAGPNIVNASAGDDTIKATLNDGNDLYNGGTGIDAVDYSELTSPVMTILTPFGGLATGSQSGIDVLTSIENVIGSKAADTIVGNAVANLLAGGPGNDRLTGGAGPDAFAFAKPTDGFDTITDFTCGQDVFQISAEGFGLVGASVNVAASANPLSALNPTDQGIFVLDNRGANAGTLYWDASGADAVALAKLNSSSGGSVTSLSASDFKVVADAALFAQQVAGFAAASGPSGQSLFVQEGSQQVLAPTLTQPLAA
jgi:VCBS repeat-containing protein